MEEEEEEEEEGEEEEEEEEEKEEEEENTGLDLPQSWTRRGRGASVPRSRRWR